LKHRSLDDSTDRWPHAAWLIALAALAIALRVVAVFAVGSYRLDRVTYEHGEIARNVVEGRGFAVRWMGTEGPTSQQAPVYPTVVAGFYWLVGVESPAALLALQLFQATLGGLLAVITTLLCRELLPDRPRVAWLAGVGAAVYPTLLYATTQVQVASLATVLVVAVLWLAGRSARTRSLLTSAACGVASGLLVLTDPILLLVVLVALAMLLRSHGVVRTALMCAACSVVISPWIARNYVVHGELVFVKSTFGYAFWQGNHPRSFGTDKLPAAALETSKTPAPARESRPAFAPREREQQLWQARHEETFYIDDVVLPPERVAELGRLTEPERSRRLFAESLAHFREHPWHFVSLCARRLRYFLLFDETNPKSRVAAYRVSHASLLVSSLVGLWFSRRAARRLWPTYAVFGLVTAFHSLTIVSARFHIPLEPMQIIWAACGVDAIACSLSAAICRTAVSPRGIVQPFGGSALASPRDPA
jgi:hypothetical protein